MTITEITSEVGYNDAIYFSKAFSKQMKVTLSEYKTQNDKKEHA